MRLSARVSKKSPFHCFSMFGLLKKNKKKKADGHMRRSEQNGIHKITRLRDNNAYQFSSRNFLFSYIEISKLQKKNKKNGTRHASKINF